MVSILISALLVISPPVVSAAGEELVVPTEVHIEAQQALAKTSEYFTCWNIDASRNREFFDRDLDVEKDFGAQLARQARAISEGSAAGFSLLRFGGTGNDQLTYEFGSTSCPPVTSNDLKPRECLNQTHWSNLLNFTRASKAKIIFGVAQPKWVGPPTPAETWDPSNAREILQWTLDNGYGDLIFGLELGNECDGGHNSGANGALKLQVLHNLTLELWPEASSRPVLLGPDAAHQNSSEPHPYSPRDDFVHDYFEAAGKLGLPIVGATLHKYIETDTERDLNGSFLDETTDRFSQYKNDVLKGWKDSGSSAAAPRLWGGEIGPHNGGSPPCNHSSMRWANFGDTLWYVDSMASASKLEYEAYCRQDFIGADYGLCDCSTGAPLPDFWAAVLWAQLTGATVLSTDEERPAESLRTYAHCTPRSMGPAGSVTFVALNLDQAELKLNVSISGVRQGRALAFQLTQLDAPWLTNATGIEGTGAMLNGQQLLLLSNGEVPDVMAMGQEISSVEGGFRLAAQSVTFLVFHDARAPACAAALLV